MNYNYYTAIKEDIYNELLETPELLENYTADDFNDDLESIFDSLDDDLMYSDAITGNGSGSYTFNRWQAREYVFENYDLAREVLTEGLVEKEEIADIFLDEDFERLDVFIRCYLLHSVLLEVLEEIRDAINEQEATENAKSIAYLLVA